MTSKYNIIQLSLCCQSNLNVSYLEHMAVLPLCLSVKRCSLEPEKKRILGLEEITSSLKVLCTNACFLITLVKPTPATLTEKLFFKVKRIAAYFLLTLEQPLCFMSNGRNSCQFTLDSRGKHTWIPRFGFGDLKFTELSILNNLHVWDEILNSHWSEIEFFHWP